MRTNHKLNPYLPQIRKALDSFKRISDVPFYVLADEAGFTNARLSAIMAGKSNFGPTSYRRLRKAMEKYMGSINDKDDPFPRVDALKQYIRDYDAAWRGYTLYKAVYELFNANLEPKPTVTELFEILELASKVHGTKKAAG